MRIKRVHLFLLVIFLIPSGCQRLAFDQSEVGVEGGHLLDVPLIRYHVAGRSVQNRPLEYFVLGDGRDVSLLIGTIHGNEAAGKWLLLELADYLRANKQFLEGRMVVVMPVANPDGRAANSRYNVHGVDLNRNFDSDNRINNSQSGQTALSEPESVAIKQITKQYNPVRIVSIHQPLRCLDYDGPAEGLARAMGEFCDLPVKKLGSRLGSFGSYAGVDRGIPIVTMELSDYDSQLGSVELWEKYGRAILAAIIYPQRLHF